MSQHQHLAGVYAAALTPLKGDYSPALDDLLLLLEFLAGRGCHGVLLHGTTGEGPSFAPNERLAVWEAALAIRQSHPDFRLLAGTGTPSLEESIQLTQAAFDLGFDGVVTLPPYYLRDVSDEGLYAWFSKLIERAVSPGKALFGYHIPSISGVPLSLDLLERLKEAYPGRFAGIKDSSGDPEHAKELGRRFGKDLLVLTGNDRLFSLALENHASGCITAMANLVSPDLRRIWEAFQDGKLDPEAQARLEAARGIFEAYPPAPPLLKFLVNKLFGLPLWTLRPPLLPFSPDLEETVLAETRHKLNL